ncbi:uncharacterized protein EV422DRAFT_76996 [Fimicolochytrium jonesii]|uniref:uncharacterized protein n=1 Tax=Fimicolochytrium jonesii TaxID=1396493 RepID=UPI0022FF2AF3|nr:uncharacterized protein EV422DRAFT_76996 [Fimicolochytrium jonesii]KAI8820574.1 hypothetical protein EV422DRAFT_76996 [Fimicolochytrium jonesii]
MLAECDVAENLTKALRPDSATESIVTSYQVDALRALRRLSTCEACVERMLGAGTFELLISTTHFTSHSSSTCAIIVEILWNALETHHGTRVADVLSTEQGVLDTLWRLLIRENPMGTGKGEEEPGMWFIAQKEMFALLERFLEDGLLDFVLDHLSFTDLPPSIGCWSLRHLKGLQMQALTILQHILTSTLRPFHAHPTLHTTLLSFLAQALEQDPPTRCPHDNGGNATSEYVGLVPGVLRTLVLMCESEGRNCGVLGEKGIFEILLDILNHTPALPHPTRTTTLTLLTTLLTPLPNRHIFASHPHAIPTLFTHLPLTPLGALTTLWASLPPSLNAILAHDGIQKVLDTLVCVGDWERLGAGLGFLCDVCEVEGCRRVVRMWRDGEGRGVVGWLVGLWRGVEGELGVPQGPQGSLVISTLPPSPGTTTPLIRNPLTGTRTVKPLAHQHHEPALQDDFTEELEEVGWNLRAKVWALVQYLGPPGLDANGTHREGAEDPDADGAEDLTPEDKVKLVLINSYPTFKHHLLLRTLHTSLYKSNIAPTAPDRAVLAASERILLSKIHAIHAEQQRIIAKHVERVQREEREFWGMVKGAVGLMGVQEGCRPRLRMEEKLGREWRAVRAGRVRIGREGGGVGERSVLERGDAREGSRVLVGLE